MKVVNNLLSGSSFTCQKPELASSFENILPSESRLNISFTRGSGYISLSTLLFRLVKSTHILILPPVFGAMVRPEHHSVGSSTGSTIPLASISSNSAFAFSFKPAAITRGAYKLFGTASLFRRILNTPDNVPNPLKTLGKVSRGSNLLTHKALITASKFKLRISGSPRRFFLEPFRT